MIHVNLRGVHANNMPGGLKTATRSKYQRMA